MAETAVAKKVEKIYGSFLREELVSVKPVESNGKWSNLLVAGQDKRKDPFLFNKAKRSYQVPLNTYRNGGGVKQILDDQRRVLIKKYENSFPDGMTQLEFFEKELGCSLNHTLEKTENFWRIDKRARVELTRDGLTLNLSNVMDMLKYLILLSDEMRISPSYEARLDKANYEFMLVDEGKVTSKKVEEAGIKTKAYVEYSIITDSKEKMVGFIKSLGRVLPAKYTEDWLKSEIYTILENSPANFLEIVQHPQYRAKIFVANAVEVGALNKRGDKRYTLDNGVELGDLTSVINYLEDPINQEIKMRIKAKIEMAKK